MLSRMFTALGNAYGGAMTRLRERVAYFFIRVAYRIYDPTFYQVLRIEKGASPAALIVSANPYGDGITSYHGAHEPLEVPWDTVYDFEEALNMLASSPPYMEHRGESDA